MQEGMQTAQERKAQLLAWEASRKAEQLQVLISTFWSFVILFSLGLTLFELLKHKSDSFLAAIVATIAALIPLFVGLAIYLQTWGSYIERKLEDIEAKIDGRQPYYYSIEDNSSFSKQPLHERLDRIEQILINRSTS